MIDVDRTVFNVRRSIDTNSPTVQGIFHIYAIQNHNAPNIAKTIPITGGRKNAIPGLNSLFFQYPIQE